MLVVTRKSFKNNVVFDFLQTDDRNKVRRGKGNK